MKVTTFGLDLAKRVFQLHWVDMETGEICRRQLKRVEMAEFFARREPSVVAMEACGSAHYWGRRLSGYGHEVRLIAAQFVRPFVKHNQTDAADAQAIWEAAQRPGRKFVAMKSEGQQSVLMLHRMRERSVRRPWIRSGPLRSRATTSPAFARRFHRCVRSSTTDISKGKQTPAGNGGTKAKPGFAGLLFCGHRPQDRAARFDLSAA
jgi:hypothetical protein